MPEDEVPYSCGCDDVDGGDEDVEDLRELTILSLDGDYVDDDDDVDNGDDGDDGGARGDGGEVNTRRRVTVVLGRLLWQYEDFDERRDDDDIRP